MVRSIFLLIIAIILFVLISPIAFTVNILRKLSNTKELSNYLFTIAIGIDQLGGSILYTQPDWTVSSWTYIQSKNHKEHYYFIFMKLIDFFFGKDHCKKSYEHEIKVHKEDLENV